MNIGFIYPLLNNSLVWLILPSSPPPHSDEVSILILRQTMFGTIIKALPNSQTPLPEEEKIRECHHTQL